MVLYRAQDATPFTHFLPTFDAPPELPPLVYVAVHAPPTADPPHDQL